MNNEDMDREEQDIYDRLNDGDITQAQFNQEMRELVSSYRDEAEEAAQNAYDNEMRNW